MSRDNHAKGQQDRAAGKSYDPPHGMLDEALTFTESGNRKIVDDNSAYRAGWHNADKQAR